MKPDKNKNRSQNKDAPGIQIRTPKKRAFLAAYAATCSITKAAEVAKVGRQCHYDWLASDQQYRAAFEQAKEQAAQTLEDEAIRRAYEGVERPVTIAGERELVREYSDTLLIFLLKGVRPEKYRERFDVKGELSIAPLTKALADGRERVARLEQERST